MASGGKEVLNKVYVQRLRPEVQPLTLFYTAKEKVPLPYSFY